MAGKPEHHGTERAVGSASVGVECAQVSPYHRHGPARHGSGQCIGGAEKLGVHVDEAHETPQSIAQSRTRTHGRSHRPFSQGPQGDQTSAEQRCSRVVTSGSAGPQLQRKSVPSREQPLRALPGPTVSLDAEGRTVEARRALGHRSQRMEPPERDLLCADPAQAEEVRAPAGHEDHQGVPRVPPRSRSLAQASLDGGVRHAHHQDLRPANQLGKARRRARSTTGGCDASSDTRAGARPDHHGSTTVADQVVGQGPPHRSTSEDRDPRMSRGALHAPSSLRGGRGARSRRTRSRGPRTSAPRSLLAWSARVPAGTPPGREPRRTCAPSGGSGG